ncbi:uncharacterized protein CLUP02_00844 [Colletotrichum lupini]|uniref:Uncharacterized protein n=1 Tax=Colletotrichum lupini TaxID=145971 RepID=A0A9Q8W8Q6_9PEZI|nr:uncharacterized protein CLUP02_00844 [Colletotrichum lupini]UQC74196.1 hypothetical protein CLUP02_00844 [Colletotrichum lupini]
MARPVKPTRCCRKVVDRVVRLDNAWVRPGDTNQQRYDWSLSGAEGGLPGAERMQLSAPRTALVLQLWNGRRFEGTS